MIPDQIRPGQSPGIDQPRERNRRARGAAADLDPPRLRRGDGEASLGADPGTPSGDGSQPGTRRGNSGGGARLLRQRQSPVAAADLD